MERKKFISSALLTLSLFEAMSAGLSANEDYNKINKIPSYLKKGDTIGICSPADYISLADCKVAIYMIESWGFKVKIGSSIGKNISLLAVPIRNDWRIFNKCSTIVR